MEWLFNCFVALLVIGAIVGLGIFLLSRVDPDSDPDEKHSEALLSKGLAYRSLIVLPSPEIYRDGWPESITSCQVVFVEGPASAENDERMKRLASRLLTFEPAPNASKDERIIGNVFKSEIGFPAPLRLPDSISEGARAYTVNVKMKKNTFPEGWQPQPFMDIKVVFDDRGFPHAGARRANHVVPPKYRTTGSGAA